MATTRNYPVSDTPVDMVATHNLANGDYVVQNISNEGVMFISSADAAPADLADLDYHILSVVGSGESRWGASVTTGSLIYCWMPKGQEGKVAFTAGA